MVGGISSGLPGLRSSGDCGPRVGVSSVSAADTTARGVLTSGSSAVASFCCAGDAPVWRCTITPECEGPYRHGMSSRQQDARSSVSRGGSWSIYF